MELKAETAGVNNWFTQKQWKMVFIIYSSILFLLAVLPINSSGSVLNNTYIISVRLDYLIHFIIYFFWMFLLKQLTHSSSRDSIHQVLIYYLLLGLAFAVWTESIQYFLPYRAFNINDLIANGLGVVAGLILFIK